MNKEERIIKYIQQSTEMDCLDYLQIEIRSLKKYYKAREKASERHINNWLTSRAMSTTTYSNWYNQWRMYDQTKKDLEVFIKYFFRIK